MKIITSKENPIYKNALKLTHKKYRDEKNLYLQEGIKPLEDAIGMGIEIKNIFIREGIVPDFDISQINTIVLAAKLFDKLSETRSSQGIIAVAEKKIYSVDRFADTVSGGNVLVMDSLQDPGNVGTIIRTAEAAGYSGIVTVCGTCDIYSPKVVRAAAGSILRMPVIEMENTFKAIEFLKDIGKRVVVTSLDAKINCFEVDLTSGAALVIGNEGNGVCQEFIDNADVKIKIPMKGSIESLNAAVAAGILMYRSVSHK